MLGQVRATQRNRAVLRSDVHIRSHNGSEFTATAVREWLGRLGVRTLYIEPGSPRENGYCELFSGKLRDELLNAEIFDSLQEAQIIIDAWRPHHNEVRPHSALGYLPLAPRAKQPAAPVVAPLLRVSLPPVAPGITT